MNIGILGLGTVGGGLVNILNDNIDEIKNRTAKDIHINQISVRDLSKKRLCNTNDIEITTDSFAVVNNPDNEVIIELIGGTTLAKELVEQAIKNGKHIVTANKALIATYGNELINLAKEYKVQLLFEASVAGGIPILNVLKNSLSANKIEWLVGIINGTGNFILTEMKDKGRQFDDVLSEAQSLGYAEADPTFDIEGIDAAHKLSILSAMSFGTKIDFDNVWTEGISEIEPLDVSLSNELGYTIKHLGIAKNQNGKVEMRVHPTLIPKSRLLANVDGVMNAVVVKGDFVGPTLYYGAGAGSGPTASAVMADVINLLEGQTSEALGWKNLREVNYQSIENVQSTHYLRLSVSDESGVLAQITKILADYNINIEAVIQKEPDTHEKNVMIAIITNNSLYQDIKEVISKIEDYAFNKAKIKHIFIETLD
ncbi:Homoserine dehydrogenase [hydrothermal vent metagenome]|uniref:Homoserine dehydrogenase n=1 Tax=hydrothermal vent metagenome TaxID=652676 RepID=A0A1W1CKC4_9ZZZZ